MADRAWARAGRWAAVLALLAVVGLPLAELFSAAFEQGWAPVRAALSAPGARVAVRNSLWVGVAVTVLATAAGAAAAVATERGDVPGRASLRAGLLLPLVVPPFVAAFSWLQAYGRGGLSDDLLGVTLPGLTGPVGVVAVLVVHAVPLSYAVCAAALASRSEPDLERAARVSGASALTVLRTVTLPLLRPALVAAAALVFVLAVNAFGVPAVLGTPAGFTTVTTRIYADLVRAADPAAFTRVLVLAAGLVLLTVAAVGAADASGALSRALVRTGLPGGGAAAGDRRGVPAAALLWIYLALTSGVPLLALVLVALTRAVGLPPVPENWTLANFGQALGSRTLGALGNSLVLAAGAASVAVVLGGLVAAQRGRRGGRSLGTAAILAFAVPGSALAVAVLLAYGAVLRDTLLLIGVAYLGKFWALGHRPLAGAADALPPDTVRAARASGAGPLAALSTVVVPLLRPALLAAWLLVFLFGLHELTMSVLLYGPGSETLAVVVLNLQQLGDVSATAALAVLLTAGVLGAAALLPLARRVR